MLTGEYYAPIARTTVVHAPCVSGYVAARLYVRGAPLPPVLPLEDHATDIIVENTGASAFTVQIEQGLYRDPASGRTPLCDAVSVVSGGRRTVHTVPSGYYLDFRVTSVTNPSDSATLRAQLTSKLKWDILGFTKDEQPTAFNQAGYGVVS